MKLLFDQNISYRITEAIKEYFPEAKHIKQLGLENKRDREIWDYAKANGFTIITFDSDFQDFSTLFGAPPKVIWLRIGNTSTEKIAEILIHKFSAIKDFHFASEQNELSVLEIFPS
jgi:predicted nuclease of predicted toxin-antitoxin system